MSRTSAGCARSAPLPAAAGTYVLILEASARRRVGVGALGTLELEPGFYAYVGSARGSGGLAARLSHHRRRARSPHWHVDYLRRHTALREAWFTRDAADLEHRWAEVMGRLPAARIALPRFGASDCRCASHLFRFDRPPRISAFRRGLAGPAARGSPLAVARWEGPR